MDGRTILTQHKKDAEQTAIRCECRCMISRRAAATVERHSDKLGSVSIGLFTTRK